MLSILIPVYNYNCFSLVNSLQQLALAAGLTFEIIAMDDGSSVKYAENEKINQLANCKFICHNINIGRAAIRNHLGDAASYDHFLFIDCDASICSGQFIQNYIPYLNTNQIVCGGCTYASAPKDALHSLRWKYGITREGKDAIKKQKTTFNSFTTFNFLIPKSVFDNIRFDESITTYGHEDTLFGHELRTHLQPYIHINNPLIHDGIEDNETFIRKTEESIISLLSLSKTGKYPFLKKDSKLLLTYEFIAHYKLCFLIRYLFRFCKPLLIKQLSSTNPSMRLFDFYKIGFLCSIRRESVIMSFNAMDH
ncbi:glycosyltransferase family 2 protein [Microbacter margulisiae]|uniref:Glycosyltransferase involved in cell wall biosynthesis n=1 Tax=Microbacter margulisiae TaxID=1350067 RepID=A0A7W5DQM1_9PORP|nr:glycosyltransferase [Microbacter margulisiae]MBB3187267.1 glycosyltransferase involved in cell wall biosynthesis [Microbacter margulisiae]